MLPLTCFLPHDKRGQDSAHGIYGPTHIQNRHPNLYRRTTRFAGDTHKAPQALEHQVISSLIAIWTLLPITRDRAVYQSRVCLT